MVITPLAAETLPDDSVRLQAIVAERLPKVELAELLIEVDRWCNFTEHLIHAGGATSRTRDLPIHLYAATLAQACNFGLANMAEVADLSPRQLAWTTEWYLREESLRAAITAVVNHQHRLPLASMWGGGTLSSSDGQRFPVSVKSTTGSSIPRYFGFGRGLTFYTWTSDQFSQFGTKVISSTVRDATYVLDGLLDNERSSSSSSTPPTPPGTPTWSSHCSISSASSSLRVCAISRTTACTGWGRSTALYTSPRS